MERSENAQADAFSKLAALIVEEFKRSLYLEMLTAPTTIKKLVGIVSDERCN